MPSKEPSWMAELGLSGVWWILNIPNISDYLSFGQCIDICNSLELMEQVRKNSNHLFDNNWYCSMQFFFKQVVRNKSRVQVIAI
jgi:hypothetical protein